MRQYFNFNFSNFLNYFKASNLNDSIKLPSYLIDLKDKIYKPFKKERSNLVALDIGSSGIKLVELGKRHNKIILEKFDMIALPEGCINGHHIESYSVLTEKLKEIVAKNNYGQRDAALVLSGPQIVTQFIKVPAGLEDHQLATHVELEAEKYLPFSTEEVSMDFDVLNAEMKQKGEAEVIFAATKKTYIDEYINILKASNLNVKVMDIYSCVMGRLTTHAIPNQLHEKMSDKVITVVDIGHEILTVSIFKNERQLYLKEQNFGGKILNELIQKEHTVDFKLAEELKSKHNDPAIQKILGNFINQMVMQVYHMLQFFYATTNAQKIDYIFLVGGGANLPGLTDAITTKTTVETKVLDSFAGIDLDTYKNDPQLAQLNTNLGVACGLALRSYVG